jgi:hypothetical protein
MRSIRFLIDTSNKKCIITTQYVVGQLPDQLQKQNQLVEADAR